MRGGEQSARVPDALQRSSRCCAEPGPYQAPAFVTAPALQRTASQGLRAALRPGHESIHAFIAPFTASAVIGSERTLAPQALKMALPSAGATTVTAGSPTPVAFSPLAMTLTATSGV